MLLLTGTSDIIRVITSSTATLDVHASWVDISAAVVTPGRTNTAISTATTTTIVAAPAAATQRNVKTLHLCNRHASIADDVTVQYFDGSTAFQLFKVTLAAGEMLAYVEGIGWQVFDITGAPKAISPAGQMIATTVLTSGTTFTTTARTTKIFVRIQAGGGGGGGCTSVASAAGAGGGGAAGGYAEKLFVVTPNTAYSYAIGAAGAGVSGASGSAGGNSTFAVGATTVTAFGGPGGLVGTAATTLTARAGGAAPAISTNGDVNGSGAPGIHGITLIVATPIVASGAGGSSRFGSGGAGLVAVGTGTNAIGFGSGGGGAATGASAVRTGGNGTGGIIVVVEYL